MTRGALPKIKNSYRSRCDWNACKDISHVLLKLTLIDDSKVPTDCR